MLKYQDIGLAFLHLVLLTALTSSWGETSHAMDHRPNLSVESSSLALDRRVRWREVEQVGPRCFEAHVPAAGTWWIEVTASAPATAPELVVFGPGYGEEDLSILERVSGVLLQVHRPGDYIVCLTSQAPLGDVELGNAFLAKPPVKGGDPDETEPDPEP